MSPWTAWQLAPEPMTLPCHWQLFIITRSAKRSSLRDGSWRGWMQAHAYGTGRELKFIAATGFSVFVPVTVNQHTAPSSIVAPTRVDPLSIVVPTYL